jgi:excisionase family DNA binding protein
MTPLLTVQQAAERLNVAPQLVRRLCGSGKLPASKIGQGWRIEPTDLEAFIAGHRQQPHEPAQSDCDLPALAVEHF